MEADNKLFLTKTLTKIFKLYIYVEFEHVSGRSIKLVQ